MGNNAEKENAEFGKNFNLVEHNRKMGEIRNNYAEHNINYQRVGSMPSNPK
jgi:hypothetical protein